MKKETFDKLTDKAERLAKLLNGGKGSGNFGHGGRPGKIGGSSQSGGFSKGQSVEFEYGGGKGTGKIVRKLTDKEKKDRAFLANPDAGDYYEVETDDGYKTIVWDAKIKDSGGDSKRGSSKTEKKLKDAKEKVDSLEKALKELDKEGVPFTSPRYQWLYGDYKKAEADYLKKAAEYQKSGEAKKEKSSKSSKKDSVGSAKIAKKDVQKLLRPDHDRYTREVVDVKYDSDKDRYEAKTVVKFKDGSPNLKESWSTMPGGDPKKSSSWFVDNTPTWLEELSERIDRAHGK